MQILVSILLSIACGNIDTLIGCGIKVSIENTLCLYSSIAYISNVVDPFEVLRIHTLVSMLPHVGTLFIHWV